ncbi:hypothetical protein ACHHYP_04823 [Achlya hypogyna]|uniref:N-acetyltransferase domain-containing protein n=1 Tax=Achlya hypogyna TaxID=1202772 RepID=A0A1V9YZU4_ACHHY|nr:hypothetical protein ACHHYP_04823 [Achlya hypogyna]
MLQETQNSNAFLEAIAPLVRADPDGMQFIGSVASQDSTDRWLVTDAAGAAIACAVVSDRTAVLSSTTTPADATAIGIAIATKLATAIIEAQGPPSSVPAFLDGYASVRPDVTVVSRHRLLLYVLDPARLPTDRCTVPGELHVATTTDKPILTDLLTAFFRGIWGEAPATLDADIDVQVAQRELYLWKVDGHAVACAGHSPPVTTLDGPRYRIRSVFTPESNRRRGYAAALTAGICKALLAEAPCHISLFAESANVASNKTYQRIGFVVKGEISTVIIA